MRMSKNLNVTEGVQTDIRDIRCKIKRMKEGYKGMMIEIDKEPVFDKSVQTVVMKTFQD